jgi:2-isopropylmalate synthase
MDLYDTTLRDGAQQEGISLSVQDKISITEKLDDIGIPFIEGGYAGSNPKDDEYFKLIKNIKFKQAKISAFGSTRKINGKIDNDPVIKALLSSDTEIVTLVGKSSDIQVKKVLETTLEENLSMISDSIEYLKNRGRKVIFDAEHFFDGYINNPSYSLKVLETAMEFGSDTIVLCDTNGGMLPNQVSEITKIVLETIKCQIGIHTHNDTDTAVASALAAYQSGATHIQGTINGYGERCGNANLVSIIANLQLKLGEKCLSENNLFRLTELSNFVSETVNRAPFPYSPYVGKNAFTHKGGLHASATEKFVSSYQHIDPSSIGNSTDVTISELSGKSNVNRKIKELGLSSQLGNTEAQEIVKYIKNQENQGFSYENATASFELVVKRFLPNYKSPFELIDFVVLVENRLKANKNLLCEATVKVKIDQKIIHTASEGNGPVNALDNALRKALLQSYPEIYSLRLTDYSVRVVDESAATEAKVRVAIESADEKDVWRTVGCSANILEASWMALSDSLEWWLNKNLNN